MIFKGSRYEKVKTVTLTTPEGKTISALGFRQISKPAAGYFHRVNAGDRLDLLAFQFYRNPEKFWLIADANDEMDPEDLLEPGRRLAIPPDRS